MTKVLQFEVTQLLEKAETNAFQFVQVETKTNKKIAKKQQLLDKVGGLNPLWISASFVAVLTAIGLAIIEGFMAKNAFATILDPMAINSDHTVAILGGALLGIIALIAGTELHSSIVGTSHAITGRRQRNLDGHFWLGFVLVCVVILFQYTLVQAAGEGASEFSSFAVIAVVFPIIEILFGLLFLERAISYLAVFILEFSIYILTRKKNKKARLVNELIRDCQLLSERYNIQNLDNTMQIDINPNINRAIKYFKGESSKPHDSEDNDPLLKNSDENLGSTQSEIDDLLEDISVNHAENNN